MMSSAAGTVASPSRKLWEAADIHPVSHGNTEPPKPQVASIQRESDALRLPAKKRARSSGKIGASAAPSTSMAASRDGVEENPTSSAAAARAVITAARSTPVGATRSNTREER